jgi:very-short-patch-repair endonuclease
LRLPASDPRTHQNRISIDEWLDAFPEASVRLLAVADETPFAEVTDRLRAWTPILQHLATVPDLDELLFRAVEALAARAALMWPHWYSQHVRSFSADHDARAILVNDERRREVLAAIPGVASRWLEGAIERATRGKLPMFSTLPFETQVEQLAMALDQPDLRIATILETHDPSAGLLRVARAADWLRLHSRARVLVAVPASCHGHSELDSIAYGALFLAAEAPADGDAPPVSLPRRHLHVPLGRPHHASRAEQRLAQAIAGEPSLCALFELNQRIETGRGSAITVDLLWRQGRLIIEIDGWGTHGGREAFYADRHRDYELLLSGMRVLRITDDEIFGDISLVVDKIRDVVSFIREENMER